MVALELVSALGAGAPPVLATLLAALEKDRGHKGERRHVLEAVALIHRAPAAEILLARLAETDVKTIAGRYFRAAPAVALRVLPKLASGRTKAAEVARTLLAAVLADHPELGGAALPELSAPGRRAVAAVLDRAEGRPEDASAGEIPAILARPPWRHPGDRGLVVFEALRVLDVAIPVDAALHTRDAWANRIHWVPAVLVFSPRVALPVAHAWLRRADDRAAAEAWLRAFPEIAAVGIIPAALREPTPSRSDAGAVLRFVAAIDAAAVDRAVARYDAAVGAGVASVLSLQPIHDCPYEPPRLPDFVHLEALPRPLLRGGARALPRDATLHLLEMLAFSPRGAPYAGVAMVKEACDPASLEAFAWAIVEAWLAAGAPARTAWPLESLATIGGDDSARRLTPKIRAWPGEHAPARAAAGIDVLARIGTDVALMHLASIAERARHRSPGAGAHPPRRGGPRPAASRPTSSPTAPSPISTSIPTAAGCSRSGSGRSASASTSTSIPSSAGPTAPSCAACRAPPRRTTPTRPAPRRRPGRR